jgi:hypothetical protein
MTGEDRLISGPAANQGTGGKIRIANPYHPNDLARFIREIGKRRPKRILDVGTESIVTFALWNALAASGARVVSIAWPGETYPQEIKDAFQILLRSDKMCTLVHQAPDFERIDADLHKCMGDDAADLLFIDGMRPAAMVRRAYGTFRRRVRRGGWIAWDGICPDTALTDDQDGGDLLWTEVHKLYPTRALLASGGNKPKGGIAWVQS